MELTEIPIGFIVTGFGLWLFAFIFLARNPEWIGSLAVATFFFMPALLDLVLRGRAIPTGQIILIFCGPPLLLSLSLSRRKASATDLGLILAFGFSILISIIWNGLPFWQIKSSFLPVFFLLIVYLSVSTKKGLYRIFWVYMAFILLNTCIQGLQRAGFEWAYLPSDRVLIMAGGIQRGIGISGHFSMAGLYASVMLPIAYTIFLHATTTGQRILSICLGLVSFGGIAFSVSRSALLGGFLGTLVVAIRSRRKGVLGLTAGVIVTAAIVVAVTPVLRDAAISMIKHSTTLDSSALRRPELAQIGLDVWKESPIIGSGPQAVARSLGGSGDPHNTLANILAETGIFGLIIFVAIIIRSYQALLSANRCGYHAESLALMGAMTALLPAAFFHSLNYIPLFWLIPALALALGRLPPVRSPVRARPTGEHRVLKSPVPRRRRHVA